MLLVCSLLFQGISGFDSNKNPLFSWSSLPFSKEGLQRFSEIFQRFSEVLSETFSEADFPLRGSQSCCP